MKINWNGRWRKTPSIFIATVAIILSAAGCKEEYVSVEPQRGVLEGRFNSGGYPEVIFSKTIVPEQGGLLSDILINWGKVTVNDGDREVVMTGRIDDTRLPPFRYYTYDMIGEPGKTYTVTADYGDISVSAVARMPYPTEIDSLRIVPSDVDSLRRLIVHFTSPPDVPACYYLSVKIYDSGEAEAPCMLGCYKTDRPGENVTLPVFRPRKRISGEEYVSDFRMGEIVTVSLNRVEKEVYDFWSAYDNMTVFSASPFIATDESLPCNIRGGYGIWSPQGTTSRTIVVR